MKKGNLKLPSIIISMLLAFILTTEGMFIPDGFNGVKKAHAAETLSAMQLGSPELTEDGKYFSFSSAVIDGEKEYTLMTISVDKGYICANATYPWTMTDKLERHKTATWSFDPALSASEIQAVIRSLVFGHANGMKVDISIDSGISVLPQNAVITSYKMYTDETHAFYKMHYYMYVAKPEEWCEAYADSKSYTYLGMRGYMATITEVGEDEVLDNITGGNVPAWAAGIRVGYLTEQGRTDCDAYIETDNFDYAKIMPESHGFTIANTVWIWACGPEAGMYIPVAGPKDYNASGTYVSSNGSANVNSLVAGSDKMCTYSNWKTSGEPNNSTGSPWNHEWCMLVHFGNPGQHTNYGWNDYRNDNWHGKAGEDSGQRGVQGFFVEFGGYPEDPLFDAATGLPVVEEEEENTTETTTVTVEKRWTYLTDKNEVVAKCSLATIVSDGETVTPTDVSVELAINAPCRYYNGSAYSATLFDAEQLAEFREEIGFEPSDLAVNYYTDSNRTVLTNTANSGAAASGGAPVNPGKYYVECAFDTAKIYDDFEIYAPPAGSVDPYAHYEPATDPAPILDNLTGYQRNTDGAVVISGFWGETDPEKKLTLNIGGTSTLNVDMSGVCGKNFVFTIYYEAIGDATFIDAYHQDKIADKITIYPALRLTCKTVAPTSAIVGWPAITGITNFKLDVSLNESFTNLVPGYDKKAVTGTEATISGLVPEVTFYARICPVDSQGKAGAYSYVLRFKTLEEGKEAEPGETNEIRGDRERYTIGPDGILPRGLLYGEIDYDTDFINDAVVYAKDSDGNVIKSSYINLTTEVFATDLDYNYYSTNGGKTWSKVTKKIDDKKLQSLLKKGFELKLLKGSCVKNKPAADAIIYSFEKINKRQKLSTLKVNYSIYSDYSGLSNGQWTTMINNLEVNVAKYWFGITDKAGKNLGSEGWGLWPYMDGVWVKDLVGGKQVKEKFMYKLPAFCTTPASIAKKITVYGIAKPSKSKVNYSYESFTLNKDFMIYYGEEIPDTRNDKEKLIRKTDVEPFEYIDTPLATNCKDKTITDYLGKAFNKTGEKPVKLSLTAYITDERNTVIIWKQATALKPASDKLVIKLARRGPEANEDTNFTVKSGTVKLKISKLLSYTVLDTSNNKWKSVAPKITGNTIATVRAKCTAKGGKETNDQYAIGYESYLVLEYGVYNTKSGRKGIVGAKAFADKADAEAYLAELNAKATVTPTPTPTTAP